MAISAVPFALQNGSHSADLFRQAVSSLVPPSGGLVTAGDFTITQTGTPSMGVLFGVGRAWVPGTNVGNVAGGNFSKQAMYFALNDAAVTVSVATSDPVNPRIDVAYLANRDSQYSGSLNSPILAIASGVATAGATYPANAPALPANAIAFAYITVPANSTSIINSNITNLTLPPIQPIARQHCEWNYTTSAGIPSATVWGVGTPTQDTNPVVTTDTGFVTYTTVDKLNLVAAGEYSVHFTATSSTTATGRAWLEISDGTNFYARAAMSIGENSISVSLPNFRCAANTQIKFAIYMNTGATYSFSGKIKISRVG